MDSLPGEWYKQERRKDICPQPCFKIWLTLKLSRSSSAVNGLLLAPSIGNTNVCSFYSQYKYSTSFTLHHMDDSLRSAKEIDVPLEHSPSMFKGLNRNWTLITLK